MLMLGNYQQTIKLSEYALKSKRRLNRNDLAQVYYNAGYSYWALKNYGAVKSYLQKAAQNGHQRAKRDLKSFK